MLCDNPQLLLSADDLINDYMVGETPVLSMTGAVTTTRSPLSLQRQASSQLSGSESQSQTGPGADSEAAAAAAVVQPSEQERKPWKQEGTGKTAQ